GMEPQFRSGSYKFALDYFYFLRKRGQEKKHLEKKAFAVLLEPLLLIKIDSYGAKDTITNYIRLVFGAFKSAGKENVLIASLQQLIDKNDNHMRKVLAAVRFHQQLPQKALALELDYIEHAGLPPLEKARRKGDIYERLNKTDNAIQEYEIALQWQKKQAQKKNNEENRDMNSESIHERLVRLYTSQRNNEKVLDLRLEQMEIAPSLFFNLKHLRKLKSLFKTNNRLEFFINWLQAKVEQFPQTRIRISSYILLGEYKKLVGIIAALCQSQPGNIREREFTGWLGIFKKAAPEDRALLVEKLMAIKKLSPELGMKLLEPGNDKNDLYFQLCEKFLAPGQTHNMNMWHILNSQYKNIFEIAYRLMRYYERTNKSDKLMNLGMRMARGEPPFGPWWEPDESDWYRKAHNHSDDLREDVNACLALLLQKAGPDILHQLSLLWEKHPDTPAKRQLNRRLTRGIKFKQNLKTVKWLNLSPGIRLQVSHSTVCCLARNKTRIFAGHPWGVSVYDKKGNLMTRIALGTQVTTAAADHRYLWAGTPGGIFRINLETGNTARISIKEIKKIYSLALDGSKLWIGGYKMFCLNTENNNLTLFENRDVTGKNSSDNFSIICVEENYIWVNGNRKATRFDKQTRQWTRLRFNNHPTGVVGRVDDTMFVYVYLDDTIRHRPAVINEKTLEIKPLRFNPADPGRKYCLNGSLNYFGKIRAAGTDREDTTWYPVFGTSGPECLYDTQTGYLQRLPMEEKTQFPEVDLGLSITVAPKPFNKIGTIISNDDYYRGKLAGKNYYQG
ncbi:MAG: hypothetical protein GY757_55415, partial [bacterium]|nr:hypothetical protein [bacterium]